MTADLLTFRRLIAPIDGEEFLRSTYRREPLYIPGEKDKLASLFSWEDLNGILAASSIWSPTTLELAKDGERIEASAYCYEGITRDNERGLMPDFGRVHHHLLQGATMALNQIARLTPGLRAVAESLEMVTSAQASAVAFCSFNQSAGYFSHFDTTNVFACHVEGRKLWRIYSGRHPNACGHAHGYQMSQPPEQLAKARGDVVMEVEMTPGDVLYIPHGQYHDAVATSEVSLHITYGVRHMAVQDFLHQLLPDLPGDPFFRAHLPAYDDVAAHKNLANAIAARLQQVMNSDAVQDGLKSFLQGKAYERISGTCLPQRGQARTYRVRWPGRRLGQDASGAHLFEGNRKVLTLEPADAEAAAWIYDRDLFRWHELSAAFPDAGEERLRVLAQSLARAGLLEQI